MSFGRSVRELTRLVVDAKRPNNFAIFDEINIYAGRINHDQPKVLPRPVHYDAVHMECRKIDGNTAFGFMYNEPYECVDEEDEGGWAMGEQEMTPGGIGYEGITDVKCKIKFPQTFETLFTVSHQNISFILLLFRALTSGPVSVFTFSIRSTTNSRPHFASSTSKPKNVSRLICVSREKSLKCLSTNKRSISFFRPPKTKDTLSTEFHCGKIDIKLQME
jgi:hypothetical protein